MPGQWHNRIQDLFRKEWLEIKSPDGKNIADVCNNSSKIICEIQNCYYKSDAVKYRTDNWKENGYNVIWLFNGSHANNDICLDLERSQSICSMCNDIRDTIIFVYVDDDHVYPVRTKNFKKFTAKVVPITISQFVEKFEDGSIIEIEPNVKPSKVYIRQDPPGSGKTFSLASRILETSEHDIIVCVCKEHAPKKVLDKQITEHLETMGLEYTRDVYNKAFKYVTNDKMIIIATIDSLFHQLSNNNSDENEICTFTGKAKYIENNGPTLGSMGIIQFKGESVRFCCKTLIVVDEATKVPARGYMGALYKTMIDSGYDLHLCGDGLQSTGDTYNLLCSAKEFFEDKDNIIMEYDEGDYIRRFSNDGVELLNKIIPYEKLGYKRPRAHPDAPEIMEISIHGMNVDTIIDTMRNDLLNYKLSPSDVLVVCLPTYDKVFSGELQPQIHNLCAELFPEKMNTNEWLSYLHTSTEETIDLGRSEDIARMVSVHSSQGDGRKLVYVVTPSDSVIKQYVRDDPNFELKYWSFVNVMLSRSKHIMRVFINRLDELTTKLVEYIGGDVKLSDNIKMNINTVVSSSEFHEKTDIDVLLTIKKKHDFSCDLNKKPHETQNDWTDHGFAHMVFTTAMSGKLMQLTDKTTFRAIIGYKFSENVSDKYEKDKIFIPKYAGKYEIRNKMIKLLHKIKNTPLYEPTTIEDYALIGYVIERGYSLPMKLFELFASTGRVKELLHAMIQPKLEITDKLIKFIEKNCGSVKWNDMYHRFWLEPGNSGIRCMTRVPIVIISESTLYSIYPVANMDNVCTAHTLPQLYGDRYILSNCSLKEDSVAKKYDIKNKQKHNYLFSLANGEIREIEIDDMDICRSVVISSIKSKYNTTFYKFKHLYESNFERFSNVVTNIKLNENWITSILEECINDGEDGNPWSGDDLVLKLNRSLGRKLKFL